MEIYICVYIYVHTLFLHAVVHVDQYSSVFPLVHQEVSSVCLTYLIILSKELISFPNLFDKFIKKRNMFPPYLLMLLWVWCHQTDPFTTLLGWNHHMQLQNHIGRSRRGLFGFYVSCLWTTIPEGPLLSLAFEATHDKTDSTPALHFVFALRAA